MTLTEELDLKMAEPTESGAVVLLQIGYPDSPRTYTYAAVGAAGRWYLTNMTSDPAMTWAGLVDWLKSKNAIIHELQRAATWETL